MHSYSCDKKSYRSVVVSIFVLSVMIAYGYHLLSENLNMALPWYVESPSIFGVYGIVAWLYDCYLWKATILGIRLSHVPNYEGVWQGVLVSSYDETQKINCTLTIKQSWNRILCTLSTGTSESYSYAARIDACDGAMQGIRWLYSNTPAKGSPRKMRIHNGVTYGKINEKGELICEYFNCCRDRPTYGTIELKKMPAL